MRARISRLTTVKYYGTDVIVELDDGSWTHFTIWHNEGPPSDRELALYGWTRKQYDDNIYVDDYNGSIKEFFSMDGHYESQKTFDLCQKIVDGLNQDNEK